jgi:hypothetical protein
MTSAACGRREKLFSPLLYWKSGRQICRPFEIPTELAGTLTDLSETLTDLSETLTDLSETLTDLSETLTEPFFTLANHGNR